MKCVFLHASSLDYKVCTRRVMIFYGRASDGTNTPEEGMTVDTTEHIVCTDHSNCLKATYPSVGQPN
jgi:hypothetical protein